MTHETREEERGNAMLRLLVIVILTSLGFGMLIGIAIATNFLK